MYFNMTRYIISTINRTDFIVIMGQICVIYGTNCRKNQQQMVLLT